MGLISERIKRPLRRAPRLALVMACALIPLLATGCDEAKQVGEQLGVVNKPREAPPAPVELPDYWVPVEAPVADAGQARWSEQWWQWVNRFAGSGDWPYLDPDGSRCAQHQDGPVWYLAGTDGNFEVVRNCSIPANKHLFVPVMNWVVVQGLRGEALSCEEKQAVARSMADHLVSGLVLLDNHPVGNLKHMRIASSGCFAAPGGEGASDGYWLMLKPLAPGKHQLAIAASYREGPRQSIQNFRYELEVMGEGAATTAGTTTGATDAAQ